MVLKQSFAAIGFLMAMLFAAAVQAETAAVPAPCAQEDLQCRVTALEARLDALSNKTSVTQAAAGTPVPTQFYVKRFCKVNCAEEAAAECMTRGFSNGAPEDWERPRSGPMTLSRITCKN